MKVSLQNTRIIPMHDIDVEKSDKYFNQEEWDYWNKPVDFYDFRVGKNSSGNLVVNFKSRNHKYFDITSGCSTNVDDNECELDVEKARHGSCRVNVEAQTEVWDKDLGFKLPVSSCDLVFTPETEEECQLLNGTILRIDALPEKWEYSILFMQWKDYEIVDWEGEPLNKLEEDMIYYFHI